MEVEPGLGRFPHPDRVGAVAATHPGRITGPHVRLLRDQGQPHIRTCSSSSSIWPSHALCSARSLPARMNVSANRVAPVATVIRRADLLEHILSNHRRVLVPPAAVVAITGWLLVCRGEQPRQQIRVGPDSPTGAACEPPGVRPLRSTVIASAVYQSPASVAS